MVELIFALRSGDADTVSDRLMALGALSVTVEDAQADSEHEHPIFGEPGMSTDLQAWPSSCVRVLLDTDTDPEEFWSRFRAHDPEAAIAPVEVRTITDKDWVSETQRQFAPFVIGQELWVGPHWVDPPDTFLVHGVVIRLDPGMAFGTGSHATTQLCLESLLNVSGTWTASALAQARALDMGCGSGILAIAAAKLGVGNVTAVDIDPIAVDTARRNAADNQVSIQTHHADADLTGPFDLVMANILAQPLKVLAPALTRLTRPRGALLLSGILARQADEILMAYTPFAHHLGGLNVLAERDGWVCIGTLGMDRYDRP